MSSAFTIVHSEVLAEVAARVRTGREIHERIQRRHAPDFNIFDFLRRDELGLSEVIRWLLDSRASHGQGDRFLFEFFATLDVEADVRSAQSRSEVSTFAIENRQRRLDIVVSCRDFVLAIENKPYAGWQRRQVRDYLEHLEKVAPARNQLVILTPAEFELPEDQLTSVEVERCVESGRLAFLTYPDLSPWLRRCEAICEAPAVRSFLADFDIFVRQRFGKLVSTQDQTLIVAGVRENNERTRAALELLSAGNDLLDSIFDEFGEALRAAAAERGWSASVNPDTGRAAVDFGDPDWLFAIELDWDHDWPPYFGLLTRDKRNKADHEHPRLIPAKAVLGETREDSGWEWAWWRKFEEGEVPGLSPLDFVSTWTAVLTKTTLIEWMTERTGAVSLSLGVTPR